MIRNAEHYKYNHKVTNMWFEKEMWKAHPATTQQCCALSSYSKPCKKRTALPTLI